MLSVLNVSVILEIFPMLLRLPLTKIVSFSLRYEWRRLNTTWTRLFESISTESFADNRMVGSYLRILEL
jgi:hypothetical protein